MQHPHSVSPQASQVAPADPDASLLNGMVRRDKQALSEFYAKYAGGLLAFLRVRIEDAALAEEVLQDVMLAVWQHAPQFEGRSSVKTWLLSIAHHRALNALRRARPTLIPFSALPDVPSGDTGASQSLEQRDQAQRVQQAIRQLPPAYREVLVLTFYHQLSGPEIAHVLNIALGTVKSRLARAKDLLKPMLSKEL